MGVSHIYMLCIGNGGTGDLTSGGGSGGVTVWYGAAQNVPDSLIIYLYAGASVISARFSNSTLVGTALLQGYAASGLSGGIAMPANQFTASGFFQSVAGQNGSSGDPGASSTTFLSGGSNGGTTGNYGYTTGFSTNNDGYFQLQPMIVGVGGAGSNKGGLGCGGGYFSGKGGQGMVLIASW